MLASAVAGGGYVITDEANLKLALTVFQRTHPGDSFTLLEDGPAACVLETAPARAVIDGYLESVGFYWHEAA